MLHKIFVIGSLNLISFTNGFIVGHMSCIIRSLQTKQEGIEFSEGQISLIASSLIMTFIIGIGLVAIISDKLGQRWCFILFSSSTMINWIILYYATQMYQFMLSRIIGGISVGALVTLIIFVTAEYSSSTKRALFLNMTTTVAPAIGTSFVHSIGVVYHWRVVTLIGMIPTALGIVFPYLWLESPHWLAFKGKFEECEMVFKKLHGNTLHAERELQLLIKMETSKLKAVTEMNSKPTLKRLVLAFKRKYFWELMLLCIFMHMYLSASGKFFFTMLATVLIEEITGASDILLFTLLADLLIFLGACTSCFWIEKSSMRTMLFTSGFTANAVLAFLSACIYFRSGNTYYNWIIIGTLSFYFIIINAGPCPLVDALYSEMFPSDLKLYTFFISSIALNIFFTLPITLLPYIVNSIGYHGFFLMNSIIMTICLFYIWTKLPETKGRTLQEIEAYFKTKKFDGVTSNEQIKAFI